MLDRGFDGVSIVSIVENEAVLLMEGWAVMCLLVVCASFSW